MTNPPTTTAATNPLVADLLVPLAAAAAPLLVPVPLLPPLPLPVALPVTVPLAVTVATTLSAKLVVDVTTFPVDVMTFTERATRLAGSEVSPVSTSSLTCIEAPANIAEISIPVPVVVVDADVRLSSL